MASIVISGDTSGTATLQAQAVAGNTVLTLPTTSGTFITTTGGVTPGTSGNLLVSNGTAWTSSAALVGLGFGGTTWNNVTSSRAGGTTYTNSRTYPIVVNLYVANAGSTMVAQAQVGSVLVASYNNAANYSSGSFSFIVPPGATYLLTITAGSLSFWSELY